MTHCCMKDMEDRITVLENYVSNLLQRQNQKDIDDLYLEHDKDWAELVPKLNLTGLAKILAHNCTICSWSVDNTRFILEIDKDRLLLVNNKQIEILEDKLSEYFEVEVDVNFVCESPQLGA